ncbi:HsdM family class I SAM-dependent methyltransferase [Amycolatopsis echigonensis]|uniref:N-6 DNA methylase n=1 Tax=Amycolatopsis echigonensis TaxID=2576905 RepID=A0A8E2B5T2_9PSEU|nr:N-6 DNA methylase [Amycolatopsis echigonensis]MBB2501735.1 N-6 DNA methylase [Amycolatopsis echigonensis]
MADDAAVSAADIARLAGVRRAAVSNWRRRHDDFPKPVGGTASSPLFSLPEVQAWLRGRGRPFELTPIDEAWQRLRALGDDLDLGARLASVGEYLADDAEGPDDPGLRALISRLAVNEGAAETFEQLCDRFFEAHARRLSTTPTVYADLMVRLTGAKGATVLDPACGFGSLLLAAAATRARGQDVDPDTARIAGIRLRLHGADTEVHASDALRADAFAGRLADVVLCDPPFNERGWGHEELVGDARWEYGLPPRGESELAWVQHCLAHVKPGGAVAVLMPGAAAGRRSGKRIRANLLRAGALRAVCTLAPGTDLWLLTRPAPGRRAPATVLIADTTPDDLEQVWQDFLADPDVGERIIDVLDDDVDLTPSGRPGGNDSGADFLAAQRVFGQIGIELPQLEPASGEAAHTTVGELVKAGALRITHAPPRTADGDEPVLTTDDVLLGGPPTGHAAPDPAAVFAHEGDVVASVTGAVIVHSGDPVRLGPALSRYRVDPELLDAQFLAGCLRAADFPVHSASTRIDARRLKVPRHPLETQRAYGVAFRALADFDRALRQTAEIGRDLVRLGFAALAEGRLKPGGG